MERCSRSCWVRRFPAHSQPADAYTTQTSRTGGPASKQHLLHSVRLLSRTPPIAAAYGGPGIHHPIGNDSFVHKSVSPLSPQLNLGQISMISAGVSLLSIVAMPIWGRLLDSLGGQNSYRIALVGFIVGLAVLLGAGWTPIVVFALFSYEGQRGAFGSGLAISQQYLIMVKADSAQRSVYYAAATSMIGVGWFIGANAGGILLQLLLNLGGGRFSLSAAYNMLFLLCIVLAVLLMLLIRKIHHDLSYLPGKY